MDGLKFIESLDSLWWFFNPLSSRTHQALALLSDDESNISTQNHFKDTPKSETTQPITPIVQTQLTQISNSETLVKNCPNFSNLGVKIEEVDDNEERRGSRRRKIKCGLDERRRVDFGFDLKNVDGFFWMMRETKTTFGYERRYCSEDDEVMVLLPPFSNGMVMKQHLKSWAYAVACTVR